MCVCVCVCLHLKYIVVYEKSSDKFKIELRQINYKVTIGVQKFSPFTIMQNVRSYRSTLVQARNLILSMHVYLKLIYKIYECRHA